jgi:hypothetical protein
MKIQMKSFLLARMPGRFMNANGLFATLGLLTLISANAVSGAILFQEFPDADNTDVRVLLVGFFDEGVITEGKEFGQVSGAKYYTDDFKPNDPGSSGTGTAYMVEFGAAKKASDIVTVTWSSEPDPKGVYKSIVTVQARFDSDPSFGPNLDLPADAKTALVENGREQNLNDYFYTGTGKVTLPTQLRIDAVSDAPDGGATGLLLGLAVTSLVLARVKR